MQSSPPPEALPRQCVHTGRSVVGPQDGEAGNFLWTWTAQLWSPSMHEKVKSLGEAAVVRVSRSCSRTLSLTHGFASLCQQLY